MTPDPGFIHAQRDPSLFPDGPGIFHSIFGGGPPPASNWFTEYQGRELDFVAEKLGLTNASGRLKLWAAQRYIVEALFKHKFVAVYSARSGGKTFTAGVVIPTFLYTAPSRVLVTGPGMRQILKLPWSEARRSVIAAPVDLPGRLMATEIRLDDAHYAICIPSKNPEHLRGYHAGVTIPDDPDLTEEEFEELVEVHAAEGVEEDSAARLLVVIDEPEAIPAETFRVLQGMFNKPNVYCLMIGNPTMGIDDDHEYAQSVQPGSGWHRVKISAFSEEQYPDDLTYDKVFDRVPPYLVNRAALDKAERTLDSGDPIFLSDYLGQFTRGSTASLVVPRMALEAALINWDTNRRALGPRMGVDIGTGGPDPCVAVCYFDGEKVAEHEWRPDKFDTEGQVTTASIIQGLAVKWGKALGTRHPETWDGRPIDGNRVSIDATGGVGVCDILSSRGFHTDAVIFSAKAPGQWVELVGTERFKNTRVEMHWVARRGLQEGVFKIDPDLYPRSWQQATWTHYEREGDGYGPIIKLEPKERVKGRHGRSPDNWDADIMAMRETHGPGSMFGQMGPRLGTASRQPIRNGRLAPTRLLGGRRISG